MHLENKNTALILRNIVFCLTMLLLVVACDDDKLSEPKPSNLVGSVWNWHHSNNEYFIAPPDIHFLTETEGKTSFHYYPLEGFIYSYAKPNININSGNLTLFGNVNGDTMTLYSSEYHWDKYFRVTE